jgi:hypothetical protein
MLVNRLGQDGYTMLGITGTRSAKAICSRNQISNSSNEPSSLAIGTPQYLILLFGHSS